MKLLELVPRSAIVAELAASDRNGAIRELVETLSAAGAISGDEADAIAKSIITRERTRGTTGFGKGVAAPHAKIAGLRRAVAAVGRSSRGIDFSSLDGEPVFAVFLLISPEEQPEEHLRAMDLIFRNLQQERFRKFLRQADDSEKIFDLLKEADERQLVS
ncbi:MAG: PTS sugar transporter subunit IIA [Phycisphaerales bacterium]|nr:PTS sugar transporter subunit IIA [Phycisphaerales bacterium]